MIRSFELRRGPHFVPGSPHVVAYSRRPLEIYSPDDAVEASGAESAEVLHAQAPQQGLWLEQRAEGEECDRPRRHSDTLASPRNDDWVASLTSPTQRVRLPASFSWHAAAALRNTGAAGRIMNRPTIPFWVL